MWNPIQINENTPKWGIFIYLIMGFQRVDSPFDRGLREQRPLKEKRVRNHPRSENCSEIKTKEKI